MTQQSQGRDELKSPDSDFIKEFRRLKQLRNSHQIDEPDFDEGVEKLFIDSHNRLLDGLLEKGPEDYVHTENEDTKTGQSVENHINDVMKMVSNGINQSNCSWRSLITGMRKGNE